MKRKLVLLIAFLLTFTSLKATSDFDIFAKAGMGISFFHTQGNFTEGTPQVEFSFIPYYTYGIGTTFSGIGLGFTIVSFDSPYTEKTTKAMYSLILGGTTINYYQTDLEKLFDISFSNKHERLMRRGKLLLDINIVTGFRYYKFSSELPSLYQFYFGFTLNPGYNIATFGGDKDFEE